MHITATDPLSDDTPCLPSSEALLAGTLALMTAYAHAHDGCPHRSLMAKKLVSNLFFLAEHPQVSPPLRAMLGNLRTRWQQALAGDGMALPASTPSPLWHGAPEAVQ